MKNKLLLSGLMAAALWIEPIGAQDFSADWLSGEWRGAGTVAGGNSAASLTVAPALENSHLEIDYRFVSFMPDGEPMRFAGRGYYRLRGDDAWTGHWIDSGGGSHRLEGRIDGDAMVAHWGEHGRSVYRRLDEDRLEVVDSMRDGDGDGDGEWREFARQQFIRME